jgi:hypothetical protein
MLTIGKKCSLGFVPARPGRVASAPVMPGAEASVLS